MGSSSDNRWLAQRAVDAEPAIRYGSRYTEAKRVRDRFDLG